MDVLLFLGNVDFGVKITYSSSIEINLKYSDYGIN
jgi:hypothetical protein